MHSQSSSTNLLRGRAHRVPGSHRITRRLGSPILLLSVVEASLFSMPECYLSDVFKKKFFNLQFFSFPSKSEPPAAKRIGHRGRDRSLPARPCGTRDKYTESPTCMCVCSFFWIVKKKRNNLTQVGAPDNYIFPILLLYQLTRFNAR